jgi:hypothetical protein
MEGGCYVAIMNISPDDVLHFVSFCGEGSEHYKDAKETAEQRGYKIVAEVFEISGEVVDKIKEPLAGLIKRLNAGEKLHPQVELQNLVE